MPEYIVFTCPSCNARKQTLSSNFDKRVQCECGKKFLVGSADNIVIENHANLGEKPPVATRTKQLNRVQNCATNTKETPYDDFVLKPQKRSFSVIRYFFKIILAILTIVIHILILIINSQWHSNSRKSAYVRGHFRRTKRGFTWVRGHYRK